MLEQPHDVGVEQPGADPALLHDGVAIGEVAHTLGQNPLDDDPLGERARLREPDLGHAPNAEAFVQAEVAELRAQLAALRARLDEPR